MNAACLSIHLLDLVSMLSPDLIFATDDTIRAAADAGLSSSNTGLLDNLLTQEDQLDYHQLISTELPEPLLHSLLQLTTLLRPHSAATTWMATVLLKKLIVQQHSIDIITVVASLTLSHKYLHSQSHPVDYEFIAHCCGIDDSQCIQDTEVTLLDALSYDISVCTPDDFFSYLSNCAHDDAKTLELIAQARRSLSQHHTALGLVHNYPSSVVALSLMCTVSASDFATEQLKAFLRHKKDPRHYLTQVVQCMAQLQTYSA